MSGTEVYDIWIHAKYCWRWILRIWLGEAGRAFRKRSSRDDDKPEETDLLAQVKRLRSTVEGDHDARLRGIEINIRWLMVLVGGEVLAIVGFAISSTAGV